MLELEIYIVTILALLFTVAYAVGSRWNYKIQKKIWKTLSKEMKPYSKEVAFKGLGSSGFKIGCKPKTGQLTKLEVSISLVSREIPLYYLFSRCKGKYDNIAVKSNFRTAPNFTLEIIKKGSKLRREILKNPKLKEIQLEKLPENFLVYSSTQSQAIEFLSDMNVVSKIRKFSEHMERLSITDKEPHLLLSCAMEETIISHLLALASLCGKAVEPKSDKKFKAKSKHDK